MSKNQIQHFSYDDETLNIVWGDQHRSVFHYIWLRDNAPDNRHANGQKLIETANIPLDSKPNNVRVNGTVDLTWADDGSISQFDPAWLRANAYEQDEVNQRRNLIQTWRSADMQTPTFHDFEAMAANDAILQPMLKDVRDNGFALITNVPTELKSLLRLLICLDTCVKPTMAHCLTCRLSLTHQIWHLLA